MFYPQGPTFWELVTQALSSTERGYDLLAPKFDYTPFRTPQLILEAVAAQLRPLAPFDRALDLCCGTGAGMALLRPLCREQVVGLDFSRGMLQVGRQRTAAAPGSAGLEFVRGQALRLPFGSVFDVVTCFGALGHILSRDSRHFLHEVARVLQPGGRFAVVTTPMPSPASRWYWLARLFNGTMRLRNLLWPPPFIMYYLTFRLPEMATLLEGQGLRVEVRELGLKGLWAPCRLVLATRPESP